VYPEISLAFTFAAYKNLPAGSTARLTGIESVEKGEELISDNLPFDPTEKAEMLFELSFAT